MLPPRGSVRNRVLVEMVCRERATRWKRQELEIITKLYAAQPNENLFEGLSRRASTLMNMELHLPDAFSAESFLEKEPAKEELVEEEVSDSELLSIMDSQIPDFD